MILGIVLIVKGIIGLAFRTKNNKILRVCILIFDVMFGMFFVCFVTFSAFVVHDMNDKPAEDCDYIIVLGAGLNGDEPESIGVVSSGFHIFRAKLILSDYTDATVYGIPATGQNVMTLHYILRELIVLIVDLLLGNYSII